MCKKTILLTLVMVLGLATFALSAVSMWDAGGSSNDWLDRFNWLDDQLPANPGEDTQILTAGAAIPPDQIEVNGVVDMDNVDYPTRIYLNDLAGATDADNRDTIIFNGEFLSASFGTGFELVKSGAGFGRIIVNEGAYAGAFSYIGAMGGDLIIDMNGGMLEGSWQLAQTGGTSVVLNLMGGTFKCEPINPNATATMLIDITGGTLNTGAGMTRLGEMMDAGQLVADGGTNPRAYIAINGRIVTAVIPDPAQAYGPTPFPPLTTTVVNLDQELSWSAGDGAVSHKLYLGTDPNDMALVQSSTATTYAQPGLFELNTTYYWRVDEVQVAGPDVEGSVWAFTTLAYIAVEDFESYDETGNLITGVWPSESDDWTSGSSVALSFGPVNGGEKAMELGYDNSAGAWWPTYSETSRSLVADFTPKDVKALFVSVFGDPCNAADRVYVRIADSSTSVTEYLQVRDLADANHVATADVNLLEGSWSWQTAMIDLSTLGLDLTDIQSMTIGVGDKDNPVATGAGTIYVDDIQLRTSTCVYGAPGTDYSGDCKVDLVDFGIFAGDWLDSGMWP